MARLIFFVTFMLVLAYALSLSSFKKFKPDNSRFDMAVATKKHEDRVAKIQAAMNPVVEEEKEELVKQVVEIKLDSQELKHGYEVYTKTGKCNTCHGKFGEGKKGQNAPRLAAQHAWYLDKQINDMQMKVRINEKMYPYIKDLTAKEMKDVSTFLSKLPAQPNKMIDIKIIQ